MSLRARGATFGVLLDYGLATLVQFAAMTLTSRAATPTEFGAFALVMVVYMTAVDSFAAIASTAVFVSRVQDHRDPDSLLGGMGAWAVLWAAPFALVVVVAIPFGLSVPVALGMAGAIFGRLAIDAFRTHAYWLHRLWAVSLGSLAQTLLCVVGVVVVVTAGHADSWEAPSVVWGIASLLAGALVFALRRARPTRENGAAVRRMLATDWKGQTVSYASALAEQLAVPNGIALISGLPAVGAIRLAQTLASIPLQFTRALLPPLTTRMSRRHHEGSTSRTDVGWMVAGTAVLVGVTMVAVHFTAHLWGPAAFGSTWEGARDLLMLFFVALFLNQVVAIMQIVFRVNRWMRAFAWFRTVGSFGLAVVVLAGAALDGARGASIGFVAAYLVQVVVVVIMERVLTARTRAARAG